MDLETIRDLYAVTGLADFQRLADLTRSSDLNVEIAPGVGRTGLTVTLTSTSALREPEWVWALARDHVSQERVAAVLSAAAECWAAGSHDLFYRGPAPRPLLVRLPGEHHLWFHRDVDSTGNRNFWKDCPAAVEAWLSLAAKAAGLPEAPPAPALNRSLPAALDGLHRSLGITESHRPPEALINLHEGFKLVIRSPGLTVRHTSPCADPDLVQAVCERADQFSSIYVIPPADGVPAAVYAKATDTPGQLAVSICYDTTVVPAILSTEEVVNVTWDIIDSKWTPPASRPTTPWPTGPDLDLTLTPVMEL